MVRISRLEPKVKVSTALYSYFLYLLPYSLTALRAHLTVTLKVPAFLTRTVPLASRDFFLPPASPCPAYRSDYSGACEAARRSAPAAANSRAPEPEGR